MLTDMNYYYFDIDNEEALCLDGTRSVFVFPSLSLGFLWVVRLWQQLK